MLSGSEKNISDGIGNYDDMVTVLSVDEKSKFGGNLFDLYKKMYWHKKDYK